MMFVSKNGRSAFMRFQPVELEIGWERATELAYPSQRLLPCRCARNFEFALTGYADLDLVAFFEIELPDDIVREPHCKTIAPFRDLHRSPNREIADVDI